MWLFAETKRCIITALRLCYVVQLTLDAAVGVVAVKPSSLLKTTSNCRGLADMRQSCVKTDSNAWVEIGGATSGQKKLSTRTHARAAQPMADVARRDDRSSNCPRA